MEFSHRPVRIADVARAYGVHGVVVFWDDRRNCMTMTDGDGRVLRVAYLRDFPGAQDPAWWLPAPTPELRDVGDDAAGADE